MKLVRRVSWIAAAAIAAPLFRMIQKPEPELKTLERKVEKVWFLEPDWYSWSVKNRPFSMSTFSTEQALINGELRFPFDSSPTDPMVWDKMELMKFIYLQLGLEIPIDQSVAYYILDGDGEFGPVDLTDEVSLEIIGMRGIDALHTALLIICGSTAGAAGVKRISAVRAANLIYYAATARCVGPGNDKTERVVEADMRWLHNKNAIRSLQEAVAYIFGYFDLPHPASTEYSMLDHPVDYSRR